MDHRLPRRLRTPRLRLEATRAKHGDALWIAVERSLPELRPWMAWAIDNSLEETRGFARGAERAWSEGGDWSFTAFLGDEVAGNLGLNHHDTLSQAISLGYWIRSDLTGRGLATEAGAALVDFAFEHIGVHRVELRAATGNVASRRVAEKLGFTEEGMARGAGRGLDGFHDLVQYGLLVTDARPRRAR